MHLATNPIVQQELRKELKTLPEWQSDLSLLNDLQCLNAVINETLRLHPVVLTNGIRMTGPQGVSIAGQYIPPHTNIVAPRYTISRSECREVQNIWDENILTQTHLTELGEKCFTRANDFLPQRWSTSPELIKDMSAFQPFNLGMALIFLRICMRLGRTHSFLEIADGSTGRHSCPGRAFGLLELRTVTATLISRFQVDLAPGEDGTRAMRDLTDTFIANPGRLELVFRACDETC